MPEANLANPSPKKSGSSSALSEADAQLLLWMYTLKISLETIAINKIFKSWRPVATIQGEWRRSFPIPLNK